MFNKCHNLIKEADYLNFHFFVNNKTADAVTYGGFAEYDDPGAGTFTYSVDVSIAATGASGTATADPGFVPTRLIIQLLEYRR